MLRLHTLASPKECQCVQPCTQAAPNQILVANLVPQCNHLKSKGKPSSQASPTKCQCVHPCTQAAPKDIFCVNQARQCTHLKSKWKSYSSPRPHLRKTFVETPYLTATGCTPNSYWRKPWTHPCPIAPKCLHLNLHNLHTHRKCVGLWSFVSHIELRHKEKQLGTWLTIFLFLLCLLPIYLTQSNLLPVKKIMLPYID